MDQRSSYVLSTFRHLYSVPDDVQFYYGNSPGSHGRSVRIRNKAGTFFETHQKIDADQLVYANWKDRQIPFLFENNGQNPIIDTSNSEAEIVINYDIIAASFYFLSGWQEFVTPSSEYVDGRFPYSQSLQSQLKTSSVPWVNYYFDILKTAIERNYNIKLDTRKGNTDFRIAVTHDIDTLFSGWYQEGFHALKKGHLLSPLRIILNRLRGKDQDPWNNLEYLQQMVQRVGGNSTYYFLTETEVINGKKQADYNIETALLKDQVQNLNKNGAEIGLHGSIGSHLDASELINEREKLDLEVTGGRFHYLYYDSRYTPQVLQDSGLQYDTTLGFAEQVGFRNAYTHPFYLYDLENNSRTDVLEIPLVIMDATLHHQRYMQIKPGEAFSYILPIIQEIKQFNGAAAILWHNSYFSEFKYSGWEEVFLNLLTYCQNQDGSAVKASEIVPFYTFQGK